MKTIRYIQTTIIFLFICFCATAALAAPANDTYQNAVVTTLNAPLIEFLGTNNGATKESGEPDHANNPGGKSVWYRIVPQENTIVAIWIDRSQLDDSMNTLLAVYKGFNPGPFTLIAQNDDVNNTVLSRVEIAVEAGNIYYVAVDGYNNGNTISSGNFTIRFQKRTVPSNDSEILGEATRLSDATSGVIGGTNKNATKFAGEPNITNNAGGKSVWYIWRAPESRVYTFTASCNSFTSTCFNMQMAAFKGGLNNKVASNDDFDNVTEQSSITFFAEANEYYGIAIDGIKNANGSVEEGTFILEFAPYQYRYDSNFDRTDYKADATVFRPDGGVWYNLKVSTNQFQAVQFGLMGDVPVPADYDGDGVTDYAVTRDTAQGKIWYVLRSTNSSVLALQWGVAGDKPLVGDYDGEGRADVVAVRTTAQGLIWYILQSSNNQPAVYQFGIGTDQPVIGNFVKGIEAAFGVTLTDLAVVRTGANGQKTWFMQTPGTNSYKQMDFGLSSDVNVPADYDGDGFTDVAVWRPSTGVWYIIRSNSNILFAKQWGAAGDIPQPARYNGGTMDLAVYRPSTGVWWINYNGGNSNISKQFGLPTDKPATSLISLMNP